jgi:DNA repair/transcription protein MET18/MMS19
MQALVQVQRHMVLSIFDSLVALHRDGETSFALFFSLEDPQQSTVLKSMGDRFLSSYIALADGEKDPRNLMVAFAIARVFALEFDISNKFEARFTSLALPTRIDIALQDLFNIIFCYFPITFRAPANDPYGITSEDLKNALR